MKQGNEPIDYDAFQADVRRRKHKVWAKLLAAESNKRAYGRRPRDPLKEELLLRLDKARLAREDTVRRKSNETDH